jgi:hypothetical protein
MDEARRIPFAPEDEERIASAGMWGIIVAVTSIASSVLSLITIVVMALKMPMMGGAVIGATLVPGLIFLAVGVVLAIFLLQASLAFRKVALTDEADQHYMLLGFRKLRNYFMMMGIVIIVLIGGAVLLFCGALTCGAMFR